MCYMRNFAIIKMRVIIRKCGRIKSSVIIKSFSRNPYSHRMGPQGSTEHSLGYICL
jgi:hypothetical protein